METFKYILEKYNGMKTRHICPECQKRERTFVRYIDIETGNYIADHVGRCNRETNCGYHLTPKQYFENTGIVKPLLTPVKTKFKPLPISYINQGVFTESLRSHEPNHFIKFLMDKLGIDATNDLIQTYHIGTSNHWNGATVFWQVDQYCKIRTGKVMLYSPTTGKRVKKPYDHVTWMHTKGDNISQCLFGTHLLKDKKKIVAVVESEKTAIIAAHFMPEFIWLATGGLNQLKTETIQVLKGRKVMLYPDLGAFDKWKEKEKELSKIAICSVSTLLERRATDSDRKQGYDLADYFLKLITPREDEHESETFQKIKKIECASHLNYHSDLQVCGYYDRLLEVLNSDLP